MYKIVERFRRPFYIFASSVFVMFGLHCGGTRRSNPCLYQLSRGGYSSVAGALLFVAHCNRDKQMEGTLLGVYNERSKRVRYAFPIDPAPFGFAWIPQQDAFVVTHGSRMSLFRKIAPDYDYSGTAIRCPVGFIYTFCAWNANGTWLAVNCYDLEKPSGPKLAFYDLIEETFVVTDIDTIMQPMFWLDDTMLYVQGNRSVKEVRIDSGVPMLVKTIPLDEGTDFFYGIFDGHLLSQKGKEIKIGNRTLAELDQNRKHRVIATKKYIFIATSPTDLVVFNHKGQEVNRTKVKGTIRFGSTGKDPNTVYALVESMLLHISVENGHLKILEIDDLANF